MNNTKPGFAAVDPKVDFPSLEEKILRYWKDHKIFEKSVAKDAPHGDWTFLDGPPFVTGMPHYGTLLSSIPKDIFGRYWTMKGYHVRRVWGWDGHGLPIENKVEGELGITRKKDIEEKVGVKNFIERCLHYVNQVSDEWEWYVDHIGRWVDFKKAYKTWDVPYMESVMWVFKQLYDKGHIYKGLRVSLYCPHCATPISNFEVAMDAENYKEIVDPAATYKYKLEGEENTYILAWSTTPWNKIVTPALAVNPELTYIKVKQGDDHYILAELTKEMLNQDIEYTIIDQFKGEKLLGKKFEPHYNYYTIQPGEKAFEIIGGDFVTAEEGTGVVTIAAYGEEDLIAMKKDNIHIETHLDEEGTILPDVPLFGGQYYLKANKMVNEDLAQRGLVYKVYEYPHNVPLCWRCHTRLYYAPLDAWYVNVQDLKEKMIQSNELVNWYPQHFKYGRFLKSLEHAPDWNISRNRYWGSPVPVWECLVSEGGCGERFVPGSIEELEKESGRKITDLHKPEIDEVTVPCRKCKKTVHRVPEVLDSWIEAGSASFGERHYPFGDQPPIESFYPSDFIAEYTGQIRAWFYVLHVIANGLALRKDGNFLSRNVVVEGVILGTDGRKMSKNFKNYPDPKMMIEKYGGDALRVYLMGSPVMHGEDILISEEQYRNQIRGMLLILWNTYNFFVTYANADGWSSEQKKSDESSHVLDKWILSRLHRLIEEMTTSMEGFDTVEAIAKAQGFIDELSTWYIRRSRDRVGATADNDDDKNSFYSTTFEVLTVLSALIAPITPFIAEEIYRSLTEEESVHLAQWPQSNKKYINNQLEADMKDGMEVASVVLMRRKTNNVAVKVPLKTVRYSGPRELNDEVLAVVQQETNVYHLEYSGTEEVYLSGGDSSEISDESNQDLVAGQVRDIIRKIQQQRKILGTTFAEKVDVFLPEWPQDHTEDIKKHALIDQLTHGDFRVERKKNA